MTEGSCPPPDLGTLSVRELLREFLAEGTAPERRRRIGDEIQRRQELLRDAAPARTAQPVRPWRRSRRLQTRRTWHDGRAAATGEREDD